MERDRFLAIIEALNKVPISACPHFNALATQFAVPVNTIHSIHSQEVQTRVRLRGNDLKSKLNELIKYYLAGKYCKAITVDDTCVIFLIVS